MNNILFSFSCTCSYCIVDDEEEDIDKYFVPTKTGEESQLIKRNSADGPPECNSSDSGVKSNRNSSSLSKNSVEADNLSVIEKEVEEDGEGNLQNRGQVKFMIKYFSEKKRLEIKILQATDLPKPEHGKTDPYIIISTTPKKLFEMRTTKKRNTLNPVWNESFVSEKLDENDLKNQSLNIQLNVYEKKKKEEMIGDLSVQLDDFDIERGKVFVRDLYPSLCRQGGQVGDILIGLEYDSFNSKLKIDIVSAHDLKPMDFGGSSDPYVKIWHYIGNERVEKRKTQVISKNLEPVFNKSFTYYISHELVRRCSFLIKVMDYDKLSRNDHIGSIWLGGRQQNSGITELKHWNTMLGGKSIQQLHKLKVISERDFN